MENTRCNGWWEQGSFGRHEMEGLMIQIEGQVVTGSGYDVVGMFTFDGTIDDNSQVTLVKRYLGKHSVLYKGMFNGKDRMAGVWRIDWMAGPWEIVFREEKEGEEQEANVEAVELVNVI